MSHFAPEVAKYPKSSYFGSANLLFHSLAMHIVVPCFIDNWN